MISVIICSRNQHISTSLAENIQTTIGTAHEIIVVDNSKNDHSIFSAYNRGVRLSNFPYLCFVHEDVKFITGNWGINLMHHLDDPETGIIGVAGGKMMTKVPASWSADRRYMHIVQHQSRKKSTKVHIKEPLPVRNIKEPAVVVDGVLLGARRDLFHRISFDESFTGFHGYDFDSCFQSVAAGYRNYVVYDLLIEHFSEGFKSELYYRNLMNIFKKWEEYLPFFAHDLPPIPASRLDKIESGNLAKLIRRLARTGFESAEIIECATYYADLLHTRKAQNQLRFIRIKIMFERLFNSRKK